MHRSRRCPTRTFWCSVSVHCKETMGEAKILEYRPTRLDPRRASPIDCYLASQNDFHQAVVIPSQNLLSLESINQSINRKSLFAVLCWKREPKLGHDLYKDSTDMIDLLPHGIHCCGIVIVILVALLLAKFCVSLESINQSIASPCLRSCAGSVNRNLVTTCTKTRRI
jgi:hypothetical protein